MFRSLSSTTALAGLLLSIAGTSAFAGHGHGAVYRPPMSHSAVPSFNGAALGAPQSYRPLAPVGIAGHGAPRVVYGGQGGVARVQVTDQAGYAPEHSVFHRAPSVFADTRAASAAQLRRPIQSVGHTFAVRAHGRRLAYSYGAAGLLAGSGYRSRGGFDNGGYAGGGYGGYGGYATTDVLPSPINDGDDEQYSGGDDVQVNGYASPYNPTRQVSGARYGYGYGSGYGYGYAIPPAGGLPVYSPGAYGPGPRIITIPGGYRTSSAGCTCGG